MAVIDDLLNYKTTAHQEFFAGRIDRDTFQGMLYQWQLMHKMLDAGQDVTGDIWKEFGTTYGTYWLLPAFTGADAGLYYVDTTKDGFGVLAPGGGMTMNINESTGPRTGSTGTPEIPAGGERATGSGPRKRG
jgi:hypothetical protein